jgi:hypothetical protein
VNKTAKGYRATGPVREEEKRAAEAGPSEREKRRATARLAAAERWSPSGLAGDPG